MVSTYPNSQPSDLSFTYRNYELCITNKTQINKNSLLDIIVSNKEFSHFYTLIKKAKMENIFNDTSYRNITVFVPTNTVLEKYCLTSIDLLFAKNQVNKHIINSQLTLEVLNDTPTMFLKNKKHQRLLVTNLDGNIYINNVKILNKKNLYIANNGIIHVVSGLL